MMIYRNILCVLMLTILLPTTGHALSGPAPGADEGQYTPGADNGQYETPVAPDPPPRACPTCPPGTCVGNCGEKCQEHANIYITNAQDEKERELATKCQTACSTQSEPGHPGQFMAACMEQGDKDLKCVAELISLNICLFQAAASPKESAICLAKLSAACSQI